MRISAEDLCSLTPYSHLNQRERLSSEHICYVLAGVSKEASRYLRLKYALEDGQKNKVVNSLAERVYRKQKKYLPNEEDQLMMIKLAEVAVDEALGNSLCRTCNGKGWVDTGIKRISCFACDGVGTRHSLEDRKVAE